MKKNRMKKRAAFLLALILWVANAAIYKNTQQQQPTTRFEVKKIGL